MKSFVDLRVWKHSHEVVLVTYKMTKEFPVEERFGLVNKTRGES